MKFWNCLKEISLNWQISDVKHTQLHINGKPKHMLLGKPEIFGMLRLFWDFYWTVPQNKRCSFGSLFEASRLRDSRHFITPKCLGGLKIHLYVIHTMYPLYWSSLFKNITWNAFEHVQIFKNWKGMFLTAKYLYDTVSDVVESKVHQCQQNSDA